MQSRSGHIHTYGQARPQVTPLRATVGLLVGLVVAVGLYWMIGRSGEQVPGWIELPPGAAVTTSMSAPQEHATGPVRYYLQFEMPGEASTALVQFTRGIKAAKWESGQPRAATRDDLGQRSSWPVWVREQLYRVHDVSAGRVMLSRTVAEGLYVYAWPAKERCVLELVHEGPAPTRPTQGPAVVE